MFCFLMIVWIVRLVVMKSSVLKNVCVIRWNIVFVYELRLVVMNMKLICDIVE